MKAEVQRARGDARKATDNLSSELRRYIKTATDNAEVNRGRKRTGGEGGGFQSFFFLGSFESKSTLIGHATGTMSDGQT